MQLNKRRQGIIKDQGVTLYFDGLRKICNLENESLQLLTNFWVDNQEDIWVCGESEVYSTSSKQVYVDN